MKSNNEQWPTYHGYSKAKQKSADCCCWSYTYILLYTFYSVSFSFILPHNHQPLLSFFLPFLRPFLYYLHALITLSPTLPFRFLQPCRDVVVVVVRLMGVQCTCCCCVDQFFTLMYFRVPPYPPRTLPLIFFAK